MRFPNRPNRPPLISRRELWRLGMLVVALGLVAAMMGQLRQPETADRLERMLTGDADPNASGEDTTPTAGNALSRDGQFTMAAATGHADEAARNASEAAGDEKLANDQAAASGDEFRELLALAGWNTERLATFGDDEPLTDKQREELLELLRRLKTFDATELDQWAASNVLMSQLIDQPNAFRGRLIDLTGRVRQVRRQTLPSELATRLELPAYVECELALDDDQGVATIIAARVPNAWTEMQPLDEPASTVGVFIKSLPTENAQEALFVSPAVAWYPREARAPFVSFGESLLGLLGMDAGLLDTIEQRRPILASEREAFYQMLAAAGHAGANQLIRFAMNNLELVEKEWEEEAKRLRELLGESPDVEERQQLALAEAVVRRAEKGRYSVAPLFNEPASQVGHLVALDGVVRRAVRIDVGAKDSDGPNDVVRRFGIDHYFELDLFTDDSQNNPIVFCVRELPPGFPTGESISATVRVAGFFFKSWSFHSRRPAEARGDGEPKVTRQFAPLLVGRGPIWIRPETAAAGNLAGWIFGGSFAFVLAAIWAAIWWFGSRRQPAHERVLPEEFSLPDEPPDDNLSPGADNDMARFFPQSPAEAGDEHRLQ